MLILFRLVKHVSVPCNIQFIESFEGFDKQYYTYRGSKFLIVNSAFRGRLCSVDREARSRNMAWITLQISINIFFEVRRTNKRNEDKLFFFFPKKTTKKKKMQANRRDKTKIFLYNFVERIPIPPRQYYYLPLPNCPLPPSQE